MWCKPNLRWSEYIFTFFVFWNTWSIIGRLCVYALDNQCVGGIPVRGRMVSDGCQAPIHSLCDFRHWPVLFQSGRPKTCGIGFEEEDRNFGFPSKDPEAYVWVKTKFLIKINPIWWHQGHQRHAHYIMHCIWAIHSIGKGILFGRCCSWFYPHAIF